ncbi:heterokaryon incompatibility protein-domain-containing protein [Lophiotrema nucula]|uniref:Heterokaryon incompatibility protein-domain-containing protein n=1 Tax=Lophiotrema nucula TaxID=690887 RepID=A0A6A5YHH8_9PLEO|nr:heterokaryon incompatibility protein-domain-containing protein [Lophiotrema nucula]
MTNNPKLFAIIEADDQPWQLRNESDAARNAYIYTSLPSKGDHFRLIELAPGLFDSHIRIEIEIYELEFSIDRPDYYALSYTWNDADHDNLIINGQKIPPSGDSRTTYNIRHLIWCGSRQVLISTNLRDALRRLRSVTDPVKLWVDQLCINQDDLDERATQVVTMQRIYHQARGVRIWLGEHRDDSELGIQMAHQLHQLRTECHAGSMQYPKRNEIHAAKAFGVPDLRDSPEWAGFMQLLRRPVFHRIWIVQEIVSAVNAQVLCGDSSMFDYQIFVDALDFLTKTGWIHDLNRKGQNHASFFNAILDIRLLWLQNPTLDLRRKQRLNLVKATRRFQATDPRDKIYALLPIINDYGHRDLHGCDAPIEYKSSRDKQRRQGPLDRMLDDLMKLEDEEDAIVIIARSSDAHLIEVRQTLVAFLRIVPILLEPFLRPTSNASYMSIHANVMKRFEPLTRSLHQFQIHRSSTREHKQVVVYLDTFYKDVLSRLDTFLGLLPVVNYETIKYLATSDPSYAPDIEQLQKRTDETLKRLVKVPSDESSQSKAEKESIGKRMEEGKIILGEPVGGRPAHNHQFHDWAWSARGSTVADYRRWTAAVYTDFTVKCLQDDRILDIFASVEDHGDRQQHGLPTWVPDFSVAVTRNPLKAALHKDGEEVTNYSVTGNLAADVIWDPDNPGVLCVEGHEVVKIAWLATTESATANTIDIQHVLEWEAAIRRLPEEYPTGEDTFDAYWRTLLGDVVTQDGQPTFPAPAHYRTYYKSSVALLELERAAKTGGKSGVDAFMARHGWDDRDISIMLQGHDKIIEEMAGVMLQRRLCVLADDLIGAVPVSAQVGDQVFFLKGGSVPYVLRDAGYGWYKLIGECYVHGIMRGEESSEADWGSIHLV